MTIHTGFWFGWSRRAPRPARVLVHLLPGHFAPFAVADWRKVEAGQRLPVAAGMLALDGERTRRCDGAGWEIELSLNGPLVIDPATVLRTWVADGLPLRWTKRPGDWELLGTPALLLV